MDISAIAEEIKKAQTILLTTHKQCDGDGLGSCLAVYYALKKRNKAVRLIVVDQVPKKYNFLKHEEVTERYDRPHSVIQPTDLGLIFDTNDERLVQPLYKELKKKCKKIIFVDHHPLLSEGPVPIRSSYVDTKAASTGEMAYFILKKLKIPLDGKVARALYTSLVFDTQLFRYIKGSPLTHQICAKLLLYEKNPEEVHQNLFSTFSTGKVTLLSKIFKEIEYYAQGKVAFSLLRSKDLESNHLKMDDARDVIDIIMNIESVFIGVLFRQDSPQDYKMSLRSKEGYEVLALAEKFGGGGHRAASGAALTGDYASLKKQVLDALLLHLKASAT